MASLQILRPTFSQLSLFQFNLPGKSILNPPQSYFHKRIIKLKTLTSSKSNTLFRVFCQSQDTNNQNNGEEPPESLFTKELKRRGMSPTLLEDYKQGNFGLDEEVYVNEDNRSFPDRNSVSTDVKRSLYNQREQSIALNSEGLEGLVPRAKLLLTVGGTFFFGFGPLILITVAFFCALYLYFGPSFVHDASNMYLSPSQYVDPYELLEDERISQMPLRLN
ncbi:unnamed protein product [Lupinus luteus]|uniref:Tubulin alpha-6 chain n=1 Tax=Lupinus luteus TaxID=3873 RepID=A0AAV1VU51_LUPLU